MQEEIDLALEMAADSMQRSLEHLNSELSKVRSGKPSPDIFSAVRVDYYGALTPMAQVASVKIADARTILIQPWEKGMIQPIEKAIMAANLGFNPQNDGQVIRISVPPLTEERRRQLIKFAEGLVEQTRISVRNARQEAIKEIKKAVKNGYSEDLGKNAEDEVQGLTNSFIGKAEKMLEAKEKDIMTI